VKKKPRKSGTTIRRKSVNRDALLRAQIPILPSPPAEGQKPVSVLTIQRSKDETAEQAFARNVLRPTVTAAITLKSISRERDNVPLNDLIGALDKQCDTVKANQLGRAEGMLIVQAHTLDALFNQLARRAALNEGQHMEAADRYYRLALRAQSQCRATLESLALMKNPPHLAFVKQANIGQAVQVNNATVATSQSRAREEESEPNKLMEHSNGQRLDFGTSSTAGAADSSLEAVGELDRPAHASR
jgi:hypothetical protein